MPIVRTEGGLLFFAHVPKCAGTTVEGYLGNRFGQKQRAMINPIYMRPPPHLRWSRSSPQHVDAASLMQMFPEPFFDAWFTVVRHPVVRLRSVYRYQRDVEARIDPSESFSQWLNSLPERWVEDPWYLDNHPRPMSDLVPEPCTVFRLEDGTDKIVSWLDDFVGNTKGPREISVFHTFHEQLKKRSRASGAEVEISAQDIETILELYPEDFRRFGYTEDPDAIQHLLGKGGANNQALSMAPKDTPRTTHSRVIAWGQRVSLVQTRPPGNSTPAVRHAYDLGYDGVEIDIRVTRDNVPVLMCEPTVDHTTTGSGTLSDMDFDEIKHLTLGTSDIPICTLEDAIRANAPKGILFLDCKAHDLEVIMSTLTASGVDPARLRINLERLEDAIKCQKAFPAFKVLCKYACLMDEISPAELQAIAQQGLDGVMVKMPPLETPANDFVAACHKLGLSVTAFVHTYQNTEEEFSALVQAGVDFIMTENHHLIPAAGPSAV